MKSMRWVLVDSYRRVTFEMPRNGDKFRVTVNHAPDNSLRLVYIHMYLFPAVENCHYLGEL